MEVHATFLPIKGGKDLNIIENEVVTVVLSDVIHKKFGQLPYGQHHGRSQYS